MGHAPQHFTVWAEIPTTDIDRSITFYNDVFDLELKRDDSGPNPMAMFPTADGTGVAGHIYPGTPAKSGEGPTAHFAVPGKLEEAMARTGKAGGKVLSDPITIPAGRFAYATDPDGNSIGLFETIG
ncbi:MAG: VOC family protein [Candidatus Phaeomarinobacter sp.]